MARKTQRDKDRLRRQLQLAQSSPFDGEDIINNLDEPVGVAAPKRPEAEFTRAELDDMARKSRLAGRPSTLMATAVPQDVTPIDSLQEVSVPGTLSNQQDVTTRSPIGTLIDNLQETGVTPRLPISTPTGNQQEQNNSWMLLNALQASNLGKPVAIAPRRDVTSLSSPVGSRTTTRRGFNIQDLGVTPPALLSGNVDAQQLARQLLSPMPEATGNELIAPLGTRFPQPVTEAPQGGILTQAETVAQITPEEKLLAIMNTNPTPRSIWKRLAIGAVRGAAQIDPNRDTLGSAFGRIVGGTVAQAFPQVDIAQQREALRREGLERFKIESLQREARQKQEKAEADIREGKARIAESAARRVEAAQARREAILNQVRDDKRTEVTQLLSQLEKTPADDRLGRLRVAKQLKDDYGVTVSERYGEKEERPAGNITIYDAENDRYIRATADGTPILNKDGEPIVVRPGASAAKESAAERRKRIEEEEIEREGTVPDIAQDVLKARRQSYIDRLPEDAREALNNPQESDTFTLNQARGLLADIERDELKKITSETDTIRKRNIARRMRDEGATATTEVERRAATARQGVTAPRQPGRGRVPASNRNARGVRDFSKPRVIGLP